MPVPCLSIRAYYTDAALRNYTPIQPSDPKNLFYKIYYNDAWKADQIWDPAGVGVALDSPQLLTGFTDNITDISQVDSLPRPYDDEILLYYIGASKFSNGATGFTKPIQVNGKWRYNIVICYDAWDYILAHELGHIYFMQFNVPGHIGVPYSKCPGGGYTHDGVFDDTHHPDVNNLMHHTFSDRTDPNTVPPSLTQEQKDAASKLIFPLGHCLVCRPVGPSEEYCE
ncbi:hypothetical protein [Bacillus cereus]|uniref:hypothetical protein n=1 Tax=Bacillus cereus TaxID=1396 RepID=UPI001419351E|nr:hypothetical protein [Bacillus cereus]